MSMGLDSPMEAALAINYLSQLHGGVAANMNYVWAWIAFLTAAVSFWKIKLSSSSVVVRCSSLQQHLNSPICSLSSSSPSNTEKEEEEELPTASLTTSPTSNSMSSRYTTFCSMENRRSGKFSMYYYNNNNDDDNQVNDIDTTQSKLPKMIVSSTRHTNSNPHPHPHEEEKQELLVNPSSTNYFQRRQQQQQQGREWEPLLLKLKTTEMVWYNYQDLTLLNGDVIRLWN